MAAPVRIYDIIYSVSCHESPTAMIDTMRNINYFNRSSRICIIINPNTLMHTALIDPIKAFDNVYMLSPTEKVWGTYDMYESHIVAFDFCRDNSIATKYFIPLASNCYFHKEITLDQIDEMISMARTIIPQPDAHPREGWHWPGWMYNTKVNSALKSEGCIQLYGSQHEGIVLPYYIMGRISDITKKLDFKSNLVSGHAVEEYLFATMYCNFTKKDISILCKTFWGAQGYAPSIEQVLDEDKPIVKKVCRDYNNIVRKFIREKTDNYNM